MQESKFFKGNQMNYADFKDLVQNFAFEKFKAGQTVLEISTRGDTFYIILKGL